MTALSLGAPRAFAFVPMDEPGAPSPHEALVQVRAVGICGTDVSGYRGKMPFIQYPRILGHELGVEILAVGSAVEHLQPGDRCAVEPYLNCGHCAPCRNGRTNCCETLQVLGVHCDGGLRPRLLLPAAKLHVASDLSFEQLALVETLGIGCHAVNRAEVQASDTVLVIGAGPIGLSVVEFARLTGATVHVLEPHAGRREFVQKHYNVEVHEHLAPSPFADVIFDATGSAASMSRACEFARFSGRVVFVGITTDAVPLNDALFHRRELTLLASRNALATDFKRILQLVQEGRCNPQHWVSQRIPFTETPAAFAEIDAGANVVKAIVTLP